MGENERFIRDQLNKMIMKRYSQPMTPEQRLKGGASALPVIGDAISAYDAYQSAKHGDYIGAALNGIGALPLIPSLISNTKPIKGYHGTDVVFDVFDSTKSPKRTATRINGEQITNQSYAFAQNKRVAEFYANKARTPPGVLYPGARIVEADLYLKNPYIVDMNKVSDSLKYFTTKSLDTGKPITDIAKIKEIALEKAKKNGHDGVIFKNGYDFRPYEGDIIFVFDSKQIKQTNGSK